MVLSAGSLALRHRPSLSQACKHPGWTDIGKLSELTDVACFGTVPVTAMPVNNQVGLTTGKLTELTDVGCFGTVPVSVRPVNSPVALPIGKLSELTDVGCFGTVPVSDKPDNIPIVGVQLGGIPAAVCIENRCINTAV